MSFEERKEEVQLRRNRTSNAEFEKYFSDPDYFDDLAEESSPYSSYSDSQTDAEEEEKDRESRSESESKRESESETEEDHELTDSEVEGEDEDKDEKEKEKVCAREIFEIMFSSPPPPLPTDPVDPLIIKLLKIRDRTSYDCGLL
jgi:hypothetical protein